MASHPTLEEVALVIRTELLAVKVALSQAHDKLQAAYPDEGYVLVGANVAYNDPYSICEIFEIPLFLDHVTVSAPAVDVPIFNPEEGKEFVTYQATTAFVVTGTQCNTPYPTSSEKAGCCGPSSAWKRYGRRYYCMPQTGCDTPPP